MGAGIRRLVLDVDTIGDSLSGRVTTTEGDEHEFTGWLGMLSALQAVLPATEPVRQGEQPDAGGSSARAADAEGERSC